MIHERGKRWRVVVQARRDPITGKRHQLSGSAATEREALAMEREFRRRVEAGITGRILVRDLVEEWWASGPRLAPTTAANYKLNLDNHILPVLGGKRAEEIRPRLVGQFLRRLQSDGMHPATVRKVRSVLSAVMSYAVAMEYAESNPVMKVPPPELPEAERVAPTVEEAAQLLLYAEEDDPLFHAYLWVAAEEGGRRGETLALRWKGVDFERSCVTIDSVISAGVDGVQVRGRTKTKKPRTIAVSRFTLDLLAERKQAIEKALSSAAGKPVTVDPEAFVFSGGSGSRRHPLDGKPWRPDSTTRRFRRLKERAGVRPEVDLHGLRHTMITELLAAGVDPRTGDCQENGVTGLAGVRRWGRVVLRR
ncbi:MAG TPA: tyrosine-type recombinase/integrase [Acidimicrobiales bacterium]